MKQCTRCKETKLPEYFSKDSSRKDGLMYWCKKCDVNKTKESRRKNPDTHKNIKVLGLYGIPLSVYKERMSTSDKCEICESKENLCYDHCHDTMEFRGVLCNKCNRAIGLLGDTLESLNRAIKYLQRAAK